eukprot:TRINITY_DN10027_c0_g1_i2.p1 TRINITY_DN10027_c0_g1~~TRINITY_DN10027_c0_g1_i2.p1  ORF type:complete len:290 (+),score=52.62 TRINITY_DN10027_c0_g1_i2:82-951(+)
MELQLDQRSDEWYAARKNLIVTASQFADAVNLGYGATRDFLAHIKSKRTADLQKERSSSSSSSSRPTSPSKSPPRRAMSHGIESEPIILEMYELLTGAKVRPAGLFVCDESERLGNLVGASPDGVLLDNDEKSIGLVEIKAPTRRLYSQCPDDIPERYMCQMQGQMAVTNIRTYCDFVSVCFATRELRVQRVFFSPSYWRKLESQLLKFVGAVLHDLECDSLAKTSVHARTPWPAVKVELRSRLIKADPDDGVGGSGALDSSDKWQVGDGPVLTWDMLTGKHMPMHAFT